MSNQLEIFIAFFHRVCTDSLIPVNSIQFAQTLLSRHLDTVCTDSVIPVNSIHFAQTLLSPSTRYSLHRFCYTLELDTVCTDSLIPVNSIQFAQTLLSPSTRYSFPLPSFFAFSSISTFSVCSVSKQFWSAIRLLVCSLFRCSLYMFYLASENCGP